MPSIPTSWAAVWADGWKSRLNSRFFVCLFVCLFVCGGGLGSGSDIYLYPQGIHLKTFKMSKFTVLSKDMKATESKNNTSLTVLPGTELNWNRTSGFPWGKCLNQWREQGEKVLESVWHHPPRPVFQAPFWNLHMWPLTKLPQDKLSSPGTLLEGGWQTPATFASSEDTLLMPSQDRQGPQRSKAAWGALWETGMGVPHPTEKDGSCPLEGLRTMLAVLPVFLEKLRLWLLVAPF